MEEFDNVRKGSYIMAIMPISSFMKQQGAMKLDCGIYFIKKEYDGTPTKETCALLGIPLINVTDFLDETCAFVSSIKHDKELRYIKDVQHLSVRYIQNPISKFKMFFKREDTNELLLFNIEPKGEGIHELKYPEPRITIPGGGMEEKDLRDFEKCGIREFQEETGLYISDTYERISKEKIKRGFKFTHFSSNRNKVKMFLIKNKYDNKKSISMYYLVRIE
jgi:8-oxo-dGTP pyrophosphatase MutT (NUDIX family)